MSTTATDKHVLSAERVAAGKLPLIRTEVPGMPGEQYSEGVNAELHITIISGGAKPVIHHSATGSSTPLGTDTTQITDLYNAGQRILFADRPTLNAALRVLNRTGDYKDKKAAQVIAYMTKLPMAYQSVVLTDALALKYWAPVGCSDLPGWIAAFGMTGTSDVGAIRTLVSRATDGTQRMFPGAMSPVSADGLFRSLRAGKKSSIDAYRKINSHMEMWGAIQRTDLHLRSSFLRTGDVVKVTPFKCHGGIIEATATTPFKLRPGSSVFVFNDNAGYEASLMDLGFDNEAQSLTARFQAPTWTGTRSKKSGYDMLADPAKRGSEFWVTSAPFRSNQRDRSGAVRPTTGGEPVSRELPLYVSLAAAAESVRAG